MGYFILFRFIDRFKSSVCYLVSILLYFVDKVHSWVSSCSREKHVGNTTNKSIAQTTLHTNKSVTSISVVLDFNLRKASLNPLTHELKHKSKRCSEEAKQRLSQMLRQETKKAELFQCNNSRWRERHHQGRIPLCTVIFYYNSFLFLTAIQIVSPWSSVICYLFVFFLPH